MRGCVGRIAREEFLTLRGVPLHTLGIHKACLYEIDSIDKTVHNPKKSSVLRHILSCLLCMGNSQGQILLLTLRILQQFWDWFYADRTGLPGSSTCRGMKLIRNSLIVSAAAGVSGANGPLLYHRLLSFISLLR